MALSIQRPWRKSAQNNSDARGCGMTGILCSHVIPFDKHDLSALQMKSRLEKGDELQDDASCCLVDNITERITVQFEKGTPPSPLLHV
jgi:hypothetical protein